jgi:hypothetical protein
MANLELHANKKTGHSNFEELTEAVKPCLTEEESMAKILVIKDLLIKKWAAWEEAEKFDQVEQEKHVVLWAKKC